MSNEMPTKDDGEGHLSNRESFLSVDKTYTIRIHGGRKYYRCKKTIFLVPGLECKCMR